MSDFITNAELRIEAERLCDENDELKAENARLLDDNTRLQELVNDDELHMRKVLDENARLRELVAKYSAAAKYLCGFSHCNECILNCVPIFGDVPSGWDCARMLLDKEMRELRVEVLNA